MPMNGVVVERVRMATLDVETKTYCSSVLGPDEGMSSPPSLVTTGSASSTPSSVPSASSTPCQLGTQDEFSMKMGSHDPSGLNDYMPNTPNLPVNTDQSDTDTTEPCTLEQTLSALAVDKCKNYSVNSQSTKDNKKGTENCSTEVIKCLNCGAFEAHASESRSVRCKCLTMNEGQSGKLPKKHLPHGGVTLDKEASAPKRRRRQPTAHYHSEISEPGSGIKLKIKLSPHSIGKPRVPIKPALKKVVPENAELSPSCQTKRGRRRKNVTYNLPLDGSSQVCRPKIDQQAKEFVDWGPVEDIVDGEPQSSWGCRLPLDVLRIVLLYCSHEEDCISVMRRTSRVCRLWRLGSIDPTVLHTVELPPSKLSAKFKNEVYLQWILENRLSRVRHLGFGSWSDVVTPAIVRGLAATCPNLTSLNLSSCHKIRTENLHGMLQSCTKLQRIDLTNVMGDQKATCRCIVGLQSLTDMAKLLTGQLTHLVLANNALSSINLILKALAENCPNLQVLDLSSVSTMSGVKVEFLLNIEHLQNGCTKLKILRLANSNFKLTTTPMAEQASSPGFPHLEELSVAVDGIFRTEGINDSELERILKNAEKLRLLDVRGCQNITDSSLVRIHPMELEHLFVAGSSHPKVYSDRLELVFMKWQKTLVEVDLSWTTNAAAIDAALLVISEESENQLRYLNLCGSAVTFNPIRQILTKCRHLRRLNLTSCRSLPRGVKRLHEITDLTQLRSDIESGRYNDIEDNEAG